MTEGGKKKTTLWVLEDDPGLQFFYKETFAGTYDVVLLQTIAELRKSLATFTPHARMPALLIADIGLPDGSFLEFLTSPDGGRLHLIPVLIISTISDEKILRLAFKRGAVDFIVKPFSSGEIAVKVERFIAKRNSRKMSGPGTPEDGERSRVGVGGGDGGRDGGEEEAASDLTLVVDPVSHGVSGCGSCSQLTSREFQLVNALVSAHPLGLRKETLIASVWHNVSVSSKNLEVQLARVRKKLAAVGHTVSYNAPHYVLEPTQDQTEGGEKPEDD